MNGLVFLTTSASTLEDLQTRARNATGLDDAGLVEGLLADEAGAWRIFSERYSRLILSCITRVTTRFGRLGAEDVREIYATLCLQLLSNDKKKLRSFQADRGTRLGTWLGLLATHTAYDYLRRWRRTPRFDELSVADGMADDVPDPSEATLQRERARLVERALSDLSEKDRSFVELYYVQGLGPEEVAARMNISVKTVYTKKHKLHGRLETLLSERFAA